MFLVSFDSLLGSLEFRQGTLVHIGNVDRLVNYFLLVVSITPLSPDVLLKILVVYHHMFISVFLQFFLVFSPYMFQKVGLCHAQKDGVRLSNVCSFDIGISQNLLVTEEMVFFQLGVRFVVFVDCSDFPPAIWQWPLIVLANMYVVASQDITIQQNVKFLWFLSALTNFLAFEEKLHS